LGIVVLVTNEASARRPGVRQQIEIAFSSLKRTFGLGETLATTTTTTIVGLVTRIAAKITAYTPTPFSSTGCWGVLKVRSRKCGHEPSNTHLVLCHSFVDG
jgi:hypothetical protein